MFIYLQMMKTFWRVDVEKWKKVNGFKNIICANQKWTEQQESTDMQN